MEVFADVVRFVDVGAVAAVAAVAAVVRLQMVPSRNLRHA